MGDVTFDTRTFSHFGAVVSGSEGSWAQPTRRITKAQVYGTSGDLIVEAGEFNNVEISYPIGIMQDFDYTDEYFPRSLKGWETLSNYLTPRSDKYYRLEDTYHPQYFRMARYVPGGNPDVGTANKSGKFKVTFDCMPQKWLKSGDEWVNIDGYTPLGQSFYPVTAYKAYPQINFKPGYVVEIYAGSGIIDRQPVCTLQIELTSANKTRYESYSYNRFTFYADIKELIWEHGDDSSRMDSEYATDQLVMTGDPAFYPDIYPNAYYVRSAPIYDENNEPIVPAESAKFLVRPRWYTI